MATPIHFVSNKLYPKLTRGRFSHWRTGFVIVTQLLFLLTPWVNWHGQQAVRFDFDSMRLYLFGLTLPAPRGHLRQVLELLRGGSAGRHQQLHGQTCHCGILRTHQAVYHRQQFKCKTIHSGGLSAQEAAVDAERACCFFHVKNQAGESCRKGRRPPPSRKLASGQRLMRTVCNSIGTKMATT